MSARSSTGCSARGITAMPRFRGCSVATPATSSNSSNAAHPARSIPKIAAFWRNAILFERSYDGNPMAIHRAAGDVMPAMFPAWLALFDDTLARNLAPETAAAWSELAHRIGRSLSLGLQMGDGPPGLR